MKKNCNLFTHETLRSFCFWRTRLNEFVLSRSNWSLTCWLFGKGENLSTRRKTSCSKGENQQQTLAIYGVDTGIWTQATLESFRFQDEDDWEYKIWLEVFSRIPKTPTFENASFYRISPKKLALLSFSEGGYTLSRSQNDKTTNIWYLVFASTTFVLKLGNLRLRRQRPEVSYCVLRKRDQ